MEQYVIDCKCNRIKHGEVRGLWDDWLRANDWSWRIRLSKHAESTPPSLGQRRATTLRSQSSGCSVGVITRKFQPLRSSLLKRAETGARSEWSRGGGKGVAGRRRRLGTSQFGRRVTSDHSHLILSVAYTSHLLLCSCDPYCRLLKG